MIKSKLILITLPIIMILFLSVKRNPLDLGREVLNSNLVMIANIDTIRNDRIFLSAENNIFSRKQNYVLKYNKISSAHKATGESGIYLIMAKNDCKRIRQSSLNCVFKIVNNKILITEPYLATLLSNGLKGEVGFNPEFKESLLINKRSNTYGVKIEVTDFIGLIQNLKGNSSTLKGLMEQYQDGSFEKSIIKGLVGVSSEENDHSVQE